MGRITGWRVRKLADVVCVCVCVSWPVLCWRSPSGRWKKEVSFSSFHNLEGAGGSSRKVSFPVSGQIQRYASKTQPSVWQNNFELKNTQPLRWWAAVHFIIYFCCVCTQLPPFVTQQFKERSSCQKRKWGEGKAPTVNVTGGDNTRCASCPHPCN